MRYRFSLYTFAKIIYVCFRVCRFRLCFENRYRVFISPFIKDFFKSRSTNKIIILNRNLPDYRE